MMSNSPIVIYVDPLVPGHHKEYLAFFLRVCADADLRLHAYVPTRLWLASSELAGSASKCGEHMLDLEKRSNSLAERCSILNRVVTSASAISPSLFFFPLLDDYLLPLLIRRLKKQSLGAPWSGIFFRDGFNFLGDEVHFPTEYLRSLGRLAVLRFVLKDGAKELLTLNKFWQTSVPVPVTWLPDALSSLDNMAAVASEKYGWPVPREDSLGSPRTKFLIFGAMKPRKGVKEAAEAFLDLSDAELARVELRVLGKFEGHGNYRAHAEILFDKLRQRGVVVELADAYISEQILDGALRRCDYVLAPYIRHRGSSGVMGLAAQYGRPLLSQDIYQVGKDVRQYELGVAVDCSDKSSLTEAIRAMLCGEIKVTSGMRRFRDERTPARSFEIMRETLLRLTSANRTSQMESGDGLSLAPKKRV
jgi:glycosyltransferase involved in cell wall biosynthesis